MCARVCVCVFRFLSSPSINSFHRQPPLLFRSFAAFSLAAVAKGGSKTDNTVRSRVISGTVAADGGKRGSRRGGGMVRVEEVAPERYPTIQEALYKQREEKEIPERRKKWRTRW